MSTSNANEPAFPFPFPGDPGTPVDRGMTKREWLAGMAMQGMLANQHGMLMAYEVCKKRGTKLADEIADSAVHHADALLAELAGPEGAQ